MPKKKKGQGFRHVKSGTAGGRNARKSSVGLLNDGAGANMSIALCLYTARPFAIVLCVVFQGGNIVGISGIEVGVRSNSPLGSCNFDTDTSNASSAFESALAPEKSSDTCEVCIIRYIYIKLYVFIHTVCLCNLTWRYLLIECVLQIFLMTFFSGCKL